MELRHLRYFVAVAEELHFGRAARRLHMSQPPLSQQIRKLEDELGVRLFSRTRRRVELTAAGRAFLVEARRTLEGADRAVRAALRAERGVIGELSVGFVESATCAVLPDVLRVFGGRFPEVGLSLFEMTSAEQVRGLGAGRIDVGFVRPPVEGEDLELLTVLREPLVAAVPEAHPLAGRREVSLQELAGEPFVLFPRRLGPGFYDRIVGACREAGFGPRVAQEAIQMQTIVGLVAAGIGVSLVPASVGNLGRRGVAYVPVREDVARGEVAAAWRRGDDSPVLRNFLDVSREVSGDARRAGAGAVR